MNDRGRSHNNIPRYQFVRSKGELKGLAKRIYVKQHRREGNEPPEFISSCHWCGDEFRDEEKLTNSSGEKQREEPLFPLFKAGLAPERWEVATWRNLYVTSSTLFREKRFEQTQVFQHFGLCAGSRQTWMRLGNGDLFSTTKSHFSCTWGRGFTASLLLQEPGRAGAHSLWVAFPQPPATPWVVRLQLTSELYRELSQVRNNQVISFLPLFPGLFLTQMSSPDWHNERGDGGKRWHGLRPYQEKKCWRITSLNHSLTSCLKSCWFFPLDLQNMAAGSKNSECLQTPNSISLLDFWLCSVLFLDFFLFFLPTSLPFPSSERV